MQWKEHSELEGLHAFLSASKYHWINYDNDKLAATYLGHLATLRGTELHELAAKLIQHGVKLPSSRKTLNMYVNDAIGYRMTPEQPLYFSSNAFGTADSISFRKNQLRVHDLKTGVTPASMKQLKVYNALFCLEYGESPHDIKIENRIYQNDDVMVEIPDPEEINYIMDKIVEFDRLIDQIDSEEGV